MIKVMLKKVGYVAINVFVCILNIFVRRDKDVVLIGSWMGLKYADNSRYLHQYLFYNKEELGLRRVIWVTRSEEVKRKLDKEGYEIYLCGSFRSMYWHLKAGIQIVCDAIYPLQNGRFKPDISTVFSFGSTKIQLWHGVGMKAVGSASNKANNKNLDKKRKMSFIRVITSPGGWADYYFLSTSEINKEVNYKISQCNPDKLFIGCYPRNCKCIHLLDEEKDVLKDLSDHKFKILYLPTFRSDNTNYVHPLKLSEIKDFITSNNVLWIEKPHTASKDKIIDDTDALLLPDVFDINVLYDSVDLVISDYSSAVFDAAYKKIPVIMYVPDLEVFKNGDVGFLFDVESYCGPLLAKDKEELLVMLHDAVEGTMVNKMRRETMEKITKDYFSDSPSDYKSLWEQIKSFADR